MKSVSHPQNFIASELVAICRDFAEESEKLGQIHPVQLEAIYRHKLFNLFVPREYGGLELSLHEGLRTEEAMAWADGSMGWIVTLCSGANWFIGFLSPETASEIFTDPKCCIAGSGKASGVAKVTEKGYKISGTWKYATGAPHATVFTANCLIEKDGILLKEDSGNILVRSFWFKREEVKVNRDWNSMGLIGTASHSFQVDELEVPKNRCFQIDAGHRFLDHPIFKYPFLQFAETTLAVNSSGMAISFLDLSKKIFVEKAIKEKDKSMTRIVEQKLRKAQTKLNKERNLFYSIVERSWEELLLRGFINKNPLNELSAVSRKLATAARQTVDDLYPYCGMAAASTDMEINRVWRNIHTASQHSLLLFPNED